MGNISARGILTHLSDNFLTSTFQLASVCVDIIVFLSEVYITANMACKINFDIKGFHASKDLGKQVRVGDRWRFFVVNPCKYIFTKANFTWTFDT